MLEICTMVRLPQISENINNPTIQRMTLSRSSVVAMMRGVYWPPAIWMATSSEPNVNTRNDRFMVNMRSRNAFASAAFSPR